MEYKNIYKRLEEIIYENYIISYDSVPNGRQEVPQNHPFISAREIMPYVEETLDKLGMSDKKVRPQILYPQRVGDDILVDGFLVSIESDRYFEYCYGQLDGESATGVAGYAMQKSKQAHIRDGSLSRVMNVTGHELGHLFTPRLLNSNTDEEAKATAFEYAWCRAIQEHNIGNLRATIMQRLLQTKLMSNGADNVVKALIQDGYDPLQLYWDIANGKIGTNTGTYGAKTIPGSVVPPF